MISLVPITKIITYVAVMYACLIVLMAWLLQIAGAEALGLAFKGAALLELLLIGLIASGWRIIWRCVPKFNEWIFPDLNGKWRVDIYWNWNDKSGVKKAKAYIKQNLLRFSIELTSDESESETLIVAPIKDSQSARPGLYYLYRNIGIEGAASKQTPHHGAAILKVDHESSDLLHGNYFTDRDTSGQFTMRRSV